MEGEETGNLPQTYNKKWRSAIMREAVYEAIHDLHTSLCNHKADMYGHIKWASGDVSLYFWQQWHEKFHPNTL